MLEFSKGLLEHATLAICALPNVGIYKRAMRETFDLAWRICGAENLFWFRKFKASLFDVHVIHTLPNICYILYYLKCVHRHSTANFLSEIATPMPCRCCHNSQTLPQCLNKWKKPRAYVWLGSALAYMFGIWDIASHII